MKICMFQVEGDLFNCKMSMHELSADQLESCAYGDREKVRRYYQVCHRTKLVWFDDESPPEVLLAVVKAAAQKQKAQDDEDDQD